MQDFPPNSAKARARSEGPQLGPKKIERITSAEASRRKRGLGRQFKDTFINGNGRMALDYAVSDIVVPAVRDLMFDALQGGLDRLIYGESRRTRRSGSWSPYSNVGHVNYQGMSTTSQRPPTSGTRTLSRRSRSIHNFDEIIISSRAEATDVLDTMYEWLSRYGVVTVAELYEMTGIASSHTDHKWGWTSLQGSKVVPLRNRDGNGFLLDLPEPETLSA